MIEIMAHRKEHVQSIPSYLEQSAEHFVRPRLTQRRAPRSRDRKDEKKRSNGGGWMYNAGQEAKMEILDDTRQGAINTVKAFVESIRYSW
jgi:hypothetical protein